MRIVATSRDRGIDWDTDASGSGHVSTISVVKNESRDYDYKVTSLVSFVIDLCSRQKARMLKTSAA